MNRILATLALLLACSRASGAATAKVGETAPPAAAGAAAPVLATDPLGTVWMSWLEPSPQVPGNPATLPEKTASARSAPCILRCAAFDAGTGRWGPARTVARIPNAIVDSRNLPSLSAGADGMLSAAWPESAPSAGQAGGRVCWCRSDDGGLTWSAPAPIAGEGVDARGAALATLADGRVLAAWLQGRDPAAALHLRFLSGSPDAAPDWLLDARVSGACQPVLAPLIDGGAVIAYRGLAGNGEGSPRVARLHGREWENRHAIDESAPGGPPLPAAGSADGPRIAADGGRLAVVWRTAAGAEPGLLVSTSPDAGARFLIPLRVDGNPADTADTAILHDGTALVVWRGPGPGGADTVWLRRADPGFALNAPEALASASPAPGDAPRMPPRIAIAKDYEGDDLGARVLVVFQVPGPPSALRALLVTVPEGELLAAANEDCHCAPTPMQLLGFPVHGIVAALNSDSKGVTLDMEDSVPGVMEAGRHLFVVEPEIWADIRPGNEYLARIVRRDGAWHLFDARQMERAQ